jgi:hypothetical protein
MNTIQLEVPRPLMLGAVTAADLMTANPVSIRQQANVREAIKLLIDRVGSARAPGWATRFAAGRRSHRQPLSQPMRRR